tara:strand:- start:236 stop:466 length:231 start_codon:yes stop_codon:yes gene_type:complete
MEPKFFIGQNVVVVKSVAFIFENITIRGGEVGQVVEYDFFSIDPFGDYTVDYIVKIGSRTLFFYSDELAPYPIMES